VLGRGFQQLLSMVCLVFAFVLNSAAQVSVTSFHNDAARTGQNLSELTLTPANINANTFGKLFSYSLQGKVYAQPLYLPNVTINGGVHNVVYVVTEHDVVYALDADSNSGINTTPLWSRSFTSTDGTVTTIPSADIGCPDLVPEIGITSTPTIDPVRKTLYLVARTKESGVYKMRLHALDAISGAERPGSPADISASVSGTGDGGSAVGLNMLTENQRSGLVLSNGVVYIAFASLCDTSPYHGWLLAYDAQALTQTAVWNVSANGYGGGIWAGGTAPAVDANGNLYFATGNGTFDYASGGVDISDSLVKMPAAPPSGTWQPADYFTPYNQAALAQHDLDLGSGGTLLLPDLPGGAAHPRLLVLVGKQGTIYLIDRDHPGQFNPVNNKQVVQVVPGALQGLWGAPAWWNNQLYFSGRNDVVKSFSFDPVAGALSTSSTSTSSASYLYPLGASPSISANGNTNAVLWTGESRQNTAILHAYDANNLSNELFNTTQNATRDSAGTSVRFMFPTIANGKVYFATNGRLTVYGMLVLAPRALTFSVQNAGTASASQTATFTNPLTTPMNVTGISVTGEFGNLSGTCPIGGGMIAAGTSCTLSVAFLPQGGGPLNGSVLISLADGSSYMLPLSGKGKSVTTGTGTLNMGTSAVSQASAIKTLGVTIQGSDPTTFGAISVTNPEFTIVSNTCVGTFTGPNQCSVGLTLTPAGGGARSGQLNVLSSSVPLTINLTGTGAALNFSPTSLKMGTVAVGSSSLPQTVTVNILGNRAATFGTATIAGTNPGDFSIASDSCSGQTIATNCSVAVVFTPTMGGNRYANLKFPNDDGPSPASVNVSGLGQAALSSITINPTTAVVGAGGKQSFTATGIYTDSSSKDITASVTWLSSDSRVATVSRGLVTGIAPGSCQLTGSQNGVRGSALVTVR
jgi:hypothetical protein